MDAITVTTAARRIARETNRTARGISNYFDIDGNAFASLPSDCNWTTGIPEGAVLRLNGGHISQHNAAVLLEAVRRYGPFPNRNPLACCFIDDNWQDR
ncbi:hypothetical protein BISA_1383 [Bifidobacterium saguini DSM 23967]|uniref:Uncharacterized protein n=1 Tax=Bifidobacterium saguini DSM 23967 TaxID=1437607 RepID=A0A087DCG7_9BIFI|nr:hypothetical protein [Bifidobacterium saguini]KFI93217.1 hypothetical protein BISA_1383 [Bifidobacterium saguini DSM 23967]